MVVQLLLRWVSSDVFQGAQNGFWDWWWCGQMGTLWLESVLISNVSYLNRCTIGGSIAVGTRDTICIASFLGSDAVAGFEGVRVAAIGLGSIAVLTNNDSVLVNVVGLDEHSQGGDKADGLCKEYD